VKISRSVDLEKFENEKDEISQFIINVPIKTDFYYIRQFEVLF